MSIQRINKKYQLNGLLEMINDKYKKLNYNYQLFECGNRIYQIVDLNAYGRIIKTGTLDFLLGFCEGFLFIKA